MLWGLLTSYDLGGCCKKHNFCYSSFCGRFVGGFTKRMPPHLNHIALWGSNLCLPRIRPRLTWNLVWYMRSIVWTVLILISDWHTGRQLGERLKEHKSPAPSRKLSAVAEHFSTTGHTINWENTNVLEREDRCGRPFTSKRRNLRWTVTRDWSYRPYMMNSSDWRHQAHWRSIILITSQDSFWWGHVLHVKNSRYVNFHVVLIACLNLFRQ